MHALRALAVTVMACAAASGCSVDRGGVGVSAERAGPDGGQRDARSDVRGVASAPVPPGPSSDAPASASDSASASSMADGDGGSSAATSKDTAPAPTSTGDAAPPSDPPAQPTPPPPSANCQALPPLPASFRRLGTGPRSDDITFDRDGHLISFDGQGAVRLTRDLSRQVIGRDLIGTRGGALRALASGELMLADFERDQLIQLTAGGSSRRLPGSLGSPMKMVAGPGDALYVSGQQGTIYRIQAATGAISTAGTTPFKLGGLTFSADHRTLYVGADPDGVFAMDLRADGTLEPARMWRADLDKIEVMATDACGAIYAVSEGEGRIRRVRPGGQLELVADLKETYVWSLSFGSGRHGWSELALYALVAGGGGFYEVPLGVGAAPVPSAVPATPSPAN